MTLFEEFENAVPQAETKRLSYTPKDEISALDEMFLSSQRYRQSAEFLQLLEFVSQFRQYAPFNGMLLHIQKPDAVYVASPADWEHRFGRYPTRQARPLLILQPFGPVMFLYDISDTEGDEVPVEILRPFKTNGFLSERILAKTTANCHFDAIEVRDDLSGLGDAGRAIRLNAKVKARYQDLKLSPSAEYLILLNKKHTVEERYSSLVHELAHIFCGHLGVTSSSWWRPQESLAHDTEEIEAESTSYLVCRRQGLHTTSEKYLSAYQDVTKDQKDDLPQFSINAVLQAVDYIEKMGQKVWKKPLKTAKSY